MQANMVGLIEQAQAAMQEQVGVFREAGGYIPTEIANGQMSMPMFYQKAFKK